MRNRSIAAPLSLGIAAIAAWALAWPWYGGKRPLLGYSWQDLVGLGGTEARVDVAALVAYFVLAGAILVACVRLAARTRSGAGNGGGDGIAEAAMLNEGEREPSWRLRLRELLGPADRSPTRSFAVFALFGSLFALAVRLLATSGYALSEDEKTYLFQAQLLRMGRLTVPVFPESSAFVEPFIVTRDGQWSGQYFWGHAALLALGNLVGSPWIISAAAVAVAVVFTGHLYNELEGDRRGALLAAALVAISPLVFLTGGTLHSSNVALACGVVGMWGLARLRRGKSVRAALALGLSTSLASHVRPLDQLVLLAGFAVALSVRELQEANGDHRAALSALVAFAKRLLLPIAITIPFLALHPIVNRAVSGDWRHSGYWMFNEGHGWKTFGFGRGPFGDRHEPDVAGAKTIAALVRGLFDLVGGPLPFVLFLVAALLPTASRRGGGGAGAGTGTGMGIIAALYGVAYFFYAASPIHVTGPVYYEPLVPVVAIAIAFAAIRTYDHLKTHTKGLEVAVPAVFLAHAVAEAVIVVPPAGLELGLAADRAHTCEAMAAEVAKDGPALIFVRERGTGGGWVLWPPLPSPDFDDAALFPQALGRDSDMAIEARFGAGRHTYLATCLRTDEPTIFRYDPASGDQRPVSDAP